MRTPSNKTTIDPVLPPVNSISSLELVKAKDAIEQFIYSCSHTLRAPLKSIAGLVYLLRTEEGNPEIDRKFFLQSIEKTVVKMESVLNELEQFLSNSRQALNTQPMDGKEILEEVLQEFDHVISDAHIQIDTCIKQYVPLFTDRSRLRVMLSHIMSNAIQFRDQTRPAAVQIHIRVTASVCLVRIRDNGIGIGDDILPHIFELFYRGSMQSTGSGVGLYIVKEILNKIGGMISVRSTLDAGTTIVISIPNLMP